MRAIGWVFVLLIMAGAAVAQEDNARLLHEIRFSGNEVTREQIMRQEMAVREGEPFTPEQVERSRQAITNLGLFKSVETTLHEENGRNILLVTVEERYYILPIPLLDYRPDFLADETDTNYSYGGQLRFDNLFGLNQRLKLNYEEKKYVDNAKPPEEEWEIEYDYPRIIGSPYRLEFDADHEKQDIEVVEEDSETLIATTLRTRSSASIFVSRWLSAEGRSEGWRAGAGVFGRVSRYRDIEGESGYEGYDEVALLGSIGYYKVDDYLYHRQGEDFSYSVELADETLGSDIRYFRNTFEYRRYRPVKDLNANVNMRLKVGLALGDGEAYSLGSSTSLRGYESNTVEGNFLLLGNIEYHHRLTGYQQLRGVVFVDVGNVWPEVDEVDRNRLYSSVGVGARWRVESFVDVTLRIDYAYNSDTGETETYLATKGSF